MPEKNGLKRVGVFGGSFDPVHVGHLLMARRALEQLRLDRVLLLPCAESPDGKKLAPARKRLAWLRSALRGQPGLVASDLEIRRGGVSRSVETLRALQAALGPGVQLTLLLGQDQAKRLKGWKEPKSIAKLCRLAVFSRLGTARVPRGFSGTCLHGPELEVSSTEIRKRIRAGLAVDWLLPNPLAHNRDLKNMYKKL